MSIRPPFRRYDRSGRPEFGPTPGASSGPPPIRRFKLILHRTPGQALTLVVRAVMELTGFGSAEAECRMWLAHHSGQALVLVTHREWAELYEEQFTARGLAVSIEPA